MNFNESRRIISQARKNGTVPDDYLPDWRKMKKADADEIIQRFNLVPSSTQIPVEDRFYKIDAQMYQKFFGVIDQYIQINRRERFTSKERILTVLREILTEQESNVPLPVAVYIINHQDSLDGYFSEFSTKDFLEPPPNGEISESSPIYILKSDIDI